MKKKFIATQGYDTLYTLSIVHHINFINAAYAGPMRKTTVDFWRMVWQERCQTIMMLANLVEGDKIKCHKYWPETGTQSFGPFNVIITGQQILADYTTREFTVVVYLLYHLTYYSMSVPYS